MEFGISTFGEIEAEYVAGKAIKTHDRIKQLIELARLSDELSLDVFALGEHHRNDFAISSPEMILAAAASVTTQIKFSSAVTVLSSDDPVRVFQRFATLDQISDGRAEIMAGRGSFIESFPLFGLNLKDYDDLFIEKLELLLNINRNELVSSKGKLRPSIPHLGVYPRPYQASIPIWIAVGGTPSSVVRAAQSGLPLTIAILGGAPARYKTLTDLYKNTFTESGYDIKNLQLCINEHLYLSDNSQKARDEYWPTYGKMMNKIGKERGWHPMTKQDFERLCEPEGPLMVGTPDEIVQKILYQDDLFENTRFLAQIIFGSLTFEQIKNSITLFANEVARKMKKL